MTLPASPRLELRPLRAEDAGRLHALIEENRDRLARWLRWAAGQTLDDTARFIGEGEAQAARNDGFHAAILVDGEIAGVIGFVGIDWENRSTVIGYWLDAAHEGRGTMTEAARAMVDHALRTWRLNRVEIRPAVENRRSRAVPERLGFHHDGTLRKAEIVNGRPHDIAVYSMLAEDWEAAQKTGDSV